MVRAQTAIAFVSLLTALVAQPADATGCTFRLGFAALHDLIPSTVGHCLDDEQHAGNGDGLQHTSNGLLVWRRSDNWTAFTDGYRTWIIGPKGLQERLNSERFPWEASPAQPAPKLPGPGPKGHLSVVLSDGGIDLLSGDELINSVGTATALVWVRNSNPSPRTAYLAGTVLDASANPIGKATGTVQDVQPGATAIAVASSAAPFPAAAKVEWQIAAVVPGSPAAVIQASNARADPSTPGQVLVDVLNTDLEVHTGSLTVAIADQDAHLIGYATGAWSRLGSGATTTVSAVVFPQALPETAVAAAQLLPQVTSISRHLFAATAGPHPMAYCNTDPAWPVVATGGARTYDTLKAALDANPGATLHQPCL